MKSTSSWRCASSVPALKRRRTSRFPQPAQLLGGLDGLLAQPAFGARQARVLARRRQQRDVGGEIRIVSPVLEGDTLRVSVTIADKRETKKPDRGIVSYRHEVLNHRGELVLEATGLAGPTVIGWFGEVHPEVRARLGFSPTSPQQLAGILIEPPPSLAWARGRRRCSSGRSSAPGYSRGRGRPMKLGWPPWSQRRAPG